MANSPARKKDTKTETHSITKLKTTTCPTLSGTAEITYHLGLDQAGDIHWQLDSASGGGLFSKEWVAFDDIQQALEDWPEDKPINSMALRGVFTGQSANNGSFLLACLLNEGLVETLPKKKRCHVACDPAPFLDKVSQLGKKGSKPGKKKAAEKKAKAPAKRKAPAKKKAKGN